MKPHKHAEVLRAIADGKEVQFKNQISGAWVETNHVNLNPITHPELEWRVKPEPKPDVTLSSCIGIDVDNYLFLDVMAGANIIFTFDGETGKLKAAEVIE